VKTLYVNAQGATIGVRGRALVVRKAAEPLEVVPTGSLVSLMIFGNVQVSTQAIDSLLNLGIDITFLSRSGRWRGQLSGDRPKNVYNRLAQYEVFRDHDKRLEVAKWIVEQKMATQLDWIARSMKTIRARESGRCQEHGEAVAEFEDGAATLSFRAGIDSLVDEGGTSGDDSWPPLPEARVQIQPLMVPWRDAQQDIRRIRRSVQEAGSTAGLMGLEGAASASYFGLWDTLLATTGMSFVRRSRRPAKNPLNALLNLGYMLLLADVERELIGVGLDPAIGFLHGLSYGRASLGLDLMEPFRAPVVDRTVVRSVLLRQVRAEHFQTLAGEIRLTDEGWKTFIGEYERTIAVSRTQIRDTALSLRGWLFELAERA